MIFIANKTREIEKDNNKYMLKISKINENIKINKIELITHRNSSYLRKLYQLYLNEIEFDNIPKIISIKKLEDDNKKIKLANIK